MQQNNDKPAAPITHPRLGRTRIVGMGSETPITSPLSTTGDLDSGQLPAQADTLKKTPLPGVRKSGSLRSSTLPLVNDWNASSEDTTRQGTVHLMQLSGMLRPLRKAKTGKMPVAAEDGEEDGYWPMGIQQTGPLPIINLYGHAPFGRTLPPSVPIVTPDALKQASVEPLWKKTLLSSPGRIASGLLIGVVLLILTSRLIDLPQTFQLLALHLNTPQIIGWMLLSGLAFLLAHSLRGLRWQLFLKARGQISIFKVIELYHVASLLNFLLPIRTGEAAKTLALKRIAAIPISKSLPAVAMDKALDILPPLIIIALVPLLVTQMNVQLWLISSLALVLLLASLGFLVLMARRRSFAIGLLQSSLFLLPRSLGNRLESFATGFADALLAGLQQRKIFALAALLTGLAIVCDGLFLLLSFQAIGVPISLGIALAGYALSCAFSLLPTPPGQLGSSELIGLLIFTALLSLSGSGVIAMFVFSHLWGAVILAAAGVYSLTSLGLTFSSALTVPAEPEKNAHPTV